jgi:hypothetical protein
MSDEQQSLACCHKLLQMVGLLHARGYQRLRIFPYVRMMWWRCELVPAELTDPDNGALTFVEVKHFDKGLAARFSIGGGCKPFDWGIDIEEFSVERLANTFLERFPKLSEASMGSDWAYAGWYQEMLRRTSSDLLPLAYGFDEYETTYFCKLQLVRMVGVDGADAHTEEMAFPPVYVAAQSEAIRQQRVAAKAAETKRRNPEIMKEAGRKAAITRKAKKATQA